MAEQDSNQQQPANYTVPPLAPGVPQDIGNILRASNLSYAQINEVEAFISKQDSGIHSADDRISKLYQEVQDLNEQILKRNQQIKHNHGWILDQDRQMKELRGDVAKLEDIYGLNLALPGMPTRSTQETEDVLETTKKA